MFKVIFSNELDYWRRNPIPYIFALIILALTFLSMWGMASEEVTGPNLNIQNSPHRLSYLCNLINQLVIFMVPALVGLSTYRDYSSRMHSILYSMPFSKLEYLYAKFLGSFLIIAVLSATIILGFWIGTQMPSVNPDAIMQTRVVDFLHLYCIYLLPNVFLVSVIVFAIVTYSRNIYVGFIIAIMILILNTLVIMMPEESSLFIDPMGGSPLKGVTKFWTLSDKNSLSLPLTKEILINRTLWLSIAIVIFLIFLSRFDLSEFKSQASNHRKKASITAIAHPGFLLNSGVTLHLNLISRLKLVWNLSNVHFKQIVWSWPFITIVTAGLMIVFIQQMGMAPQHVVAMLPTTSQMLRVPMFIFSGTFNLLLFLYAGILIFKDKTTRFQEFSETAPQPDWVFVLIRFLAIIKMLVLLLTVVLLSGLFVQTIHGYYRYELGHYLMELFGIQFIHFIIWICLAFFFHSFVGNFSLSFFLLLLIPAGITLLPDAADILNLPLLREHILQFNQVPGLNVGFNYSDFIKYGSDLGHYFTFKFYWLCSAIILLVLTLMVWKRGYTYSREERKTQRGERLSSRVKAILMLSCMSFIGMAFNIYYQEHSVSKTFYTEDEEDYILAQNEIKYAHFINRPQPRLAKVKLDMAIFPQSRDYSLSGTLFFVNFLDSSIDTILVGTSFKDHVKLSMKNKSTLINEDQELRYLTYLLASSLMPGDTLKMQVEIKNYPNSLLWDQNRVLRNGTFIPGNILPTLGVRETFLTNAKKRKEFGLAEKRSRTLNPTDSALLGDAFSANNMRRIDFETTITTSKDQMAFSIGDLINSGSSGDRNFFHYRSNGLIKNNISWVSGNYEKDSVSIGSKKLYIYHHPIHNDNLPDLKEGASASLNFCEYWFSPLQHKVLNMIEFPITLGTYATLNANLILVSESKMLCNIDHGKNKDYNHPFFVAAHEIAHYWWGHKVDPANVNGGKLITESVAEYISKEVVEERFGREIIREDRKRQQNTYFEMRASLHNEVPLINARPDQDYLNYLKGGLTLTTLATYIGKKRFNQALAEYERVNRFKSPPYPTSLDFVENLRQATPDTMQYMITDLFETITLYDNKILKVTQQKDSIILDLFCQKYRSDAVGQKTEIKNFTDYIRIGLRELKSQKEHILMIRISRGFNQITLPFGYHIDEVVIDPDILLLDLNRSDNTFRLEQNRMH